MRACEHAMFADVCIVPGIHSCVYVVAEKGVDKNVFASVECLNLKSCQ